MLPGIPVWQLVLRAVLIYVALLVALRVFGKREIGQFTLYDLVFILLVANALQPSITGLDTSLGGGFIVVTVLVGTNFLVGKLDTLPRFHRLFTPAPAVVVRNGECIRDVMRREGVEQDEIEMAMREHGIGELKEVQLAVLEADGTISIVPKDAPIHRSRHRIRYQRRGG